MVTSLASSGRQSVAAISCTRLLGEYVVFRSALTCSNLSGRLIAMLLYVLLSSTAQADLSNSIVYLQATGERIGSDTNERSSNFAFGVIVDKREKIVTVLSTMRITQGLNRDTLDYVARIGSRSGNPAPAQESEFNTRNEMMTFKLTLPRGVEADVAPLLSAFAYNDPSDGKNEPIRLHYLSPQDAYWKIDGKILSENGPAGHLWTTSLPHQHTPDGVPVTNQDGKVIGIIVGSSIKNTDKLTFVPVLVAAYMFPHVHIEGVKSKQMASFVGKKTENGKCIVSSNELANLTHSAVLELITSRVEAFSPKNPPVNGVTANQKVVDSVLERMRFDSRRKKEGLDVSQPIGPRWPSPKINVCWENASTENEFARSFVRQIVEDSWARHSKLEFVEWKSCSSDSPGVRILLTDEHPHTKALGKKLDGMKNGSVLNIKFEEWSVFCKDKMAYCLKAITV